MNKQLSLFESEFLANLTRYNYTKLFRSISGHLYACNNSYSDELLFDHLFPQLDCGFIISIDDLLDGNIDKQEHFI